MGTKQELIEELFRICKTRNDYVFDNELVKQLSKKYDFGNPFDVTKLDNTAKFPQLLFNKGKNSYFEYLWRKIKK